MRGQKELHSLNSEKVIKALSDENVLSLFSKEEMDDMSKEGITQEAFLYFNNAGTDLKKCGSCNYWNYLKGLNNFYGMTSCVPCIKDLNK